MKCRLDVQDATNSAVTGEIYCLIRKNMKIWVYLLVFYLAATAHADGGAALLPTVSIAIPSADATISTLKEISGAVSMSQK